MSKSAYVITPDNKRKQVALEAGASALSLEQMQSAVGGYIEIVSINAETIAIVNEEGLMKHLPHNPPASELVGRPLVGNVLIMPRAWLD